MKIIKKTIKIVCWSIFALLAILVLGTYFRWIDMEYTMAILSNPIGRYISILVLIFIFIMSLRMRNEEVTKIKSKT